MRRNWPIPILIFFCFTLFVGCGEKPLTAGEAKEAVDEVALSNQAYALTSSTVEISTNFTIGQAVETAANELKEFIATQLPCAEITLAGATLTIEYGKKSGNCTYHGQQYSGKHIITVTSTAEGNIVVDHEWQELKNALVSVTGTAKVTWTKADPSRHVVHTLTWTRLSDGKTATGSGDRLQKPLSGSLMEGITESGEWHWTTAANQWDLEILDVEMRWVDPVPQAGTYILHTPFDKTVTMSFKRLDEDTIQVTIITPGRTFTFNVSKLGTVSG
jgi:hypothetical protein